MQIDKSAIKRGMMMHGGPCPAAYVHDGSVVVSKSFDQPKATPSLKEIAAMLESVRVRLEALRKKP
jgi:hypothetical protein